jgi:HetE-like protein
LVRCDQSEAWNEDLLFLIREQASESIKPIKLFSIFIHKAKGKVEIALCTREDEREMDPVTAAAIIAALSAGVSGGATELVKSAITDGYDALKTRLKKKFGEQSNVIKSVEVLETMPDSEAGKALVKETVAHVQADQDLDIRQAAEALLMQVKGLPGGKQHIQNAIGTHIAQASDHSTASVNINTSGER